MFQISCTVNKARKVKGEFRIYGIASDSSIDRDEEMFAPEAIQKMKDRIKSDNIPLRTEHENKWYTEIGSIVDADINEQGQLIIEAVIDDGISLGKDFIHICKKANKGLVEMPGFSVAGDVLDAGYIFKDELKRHIKVYKDIHLKEISLVSNPSNKNVTLEVPFCKSVQWETLNNNLTIMTEQVTKGVFADELLEEYTERQLMDQVYTMWHTLQEILLSEDKTSEDRNSAINDFADMLKSIADEYNMLLSDDEGIIMRSHLTAIAESEVKKFTLPKFMERFVKATEETPSEEADEVLYSNETAPATSEPEKVEEAQVEHIEKSELVSTLESLMERFVKQCIEGVSAAMEQVKKEAEEVKTDITDSTNIETAEAVIAEEVSTTTETPKVEEVVSKATVATVEAFDAGSFQKSVVDTFSKMEAMRSEVFKQMEQMNKTNEGLQKSIDEIAKAALPRKSYAVAQLVEKSIETKTFNTFEELLAHNITKTGDNFQKAYAAARSGNAL